MKLIKIITRDSYTAVCSLQTDKFSYEKVVIRTTTLKRIIKKWKFTSFLQLNSLMNEEMGEPHNYPILWEFSPNNTPIKIDVSPNKIKARELFPFLGKMVRDEMLNEKNWTRWQYDIWSGSACAEITLVSMIEARRIGI